VIQNVEKLGPELCIEVIGDPLNVIVLEKGEIEVHQSGPDERISAQVPAECNGIRDCEAVRLDVAS
jgi:hypothetical protein